MAASIHGQLQHVSPFEIDLVVLNEAPPVLADRVVRAGHLLLGDSDPRRVGFEQRSLLDTWISCRSSSIHCALLARAREGRLGA